MVDHYAVLGVARDADPEIIAAAYKALARKYHPDTGGSLASSERLQALNAAYAVLRDPELRRHYDADTWSADAERREDGHPPVVAAADLARSTRPKLRRSLADILLDPIYLLVGVPVLFALGVFLAHILLQWMLSIAAGVLGSDPYSVAQAFIDLKELVVAFFEVMMRAAPAEQPDLTIPIAAMSALWMYICAYAGSGAVLSWTRDARPHLPLPLVSLVMALFTAALAWRKITAVVDARGVEQAAYEAVQFVAIIGAVLSSYVSARREDEGQPVAAAA